MKGLRPKITRAQQLDRLKEAEEQNHIKMERNTTQKNKDVNKWCTTNKTGAKSVEEQIDIL